MRTVFLFCLCIFYAVSSTAVAQSYHVTDDVRIYMHRGPSNQYKIKARVAAGSPLKLIARNKETGYVHVRTDRGVDGWIDGRYLKEGLSVKMRLPEAEKELKESRDTQATQAEQLASVSDELLKVKRQRTAELSRINESRAKTTAQVAQLENEIVRLQAEIDGMDEQNLMGWFLRGGAVALGGIIIGLIIPNLPKRRRRTDDWF